MRLRKSLDYRGEHHLKAGTSLRKQLRKGIRPPTSRIFQNLHEVILLFPKGQKSGSCSSSEFCHQGKVARWPSNDNFQKLFIPAVYKELERQELDDLWEAVKVQARPEATLK